MVYPPADCIPRDRKPLVFEKLIKHLQVYDLLVMHNATKHALIIGQCWFSPKNAWIYNPVAASPT